MVMKDPAVQLGLDTPQKHFRCASMATKSRAGMVGVPAVATGVCQHHSQTGDVAALLRDGPCRA